ncbi:hypothetical protein PR048_018972 [Dryococelus australis]|uniref:Uncharacterized protein n=1 Tax=Dryococelus australis TaxID=614101 RepID=A0ABQ9H2B0_9NEOP|nr:hypothetical protein PR048_018972 [Dryococelus australis]
MQDVRPSKGMIASNVFIQTGVMKSTGFIRGYHSKPRTTVAERLYLLASHQGDPGSIPGRVTPDFRMWESCRTMPLIGGFSRGSPVSSALSFRRFSIPHRLSRPRFIKPEATYGSECLTMNKKGELRKLEESARWEGGAARASLNSEVLITDEGEVRRVWSSTAMQGMEGTEKTRRTALSSGTIPTFENPWVTPPEIESSSPCCGPSALTTTLQRPHVRKERGTTYHTHSSLLDTRSRRFPFRRSLLPLLVFYRSELSYSFTRQVLARRPVTLIPEHLVLSTWKVQRTPSHTERMRSVIQSIPQINTEINTTCVSSVPRENNDHILGHPPLNFHAIPNLTLTCCRRYRITTLHPPPHPSVWHGPTTRMDCRAVSPGDNQKQLVMSTLKFSAKTSREAKRLRTGIFDRMSAGSRFVFPPEIWAVPVGSGSRSEAKFSSGMRIETICCAVGGYRVHNCPSARQTHNQCRTVKCFEYPVWSREEQNVLRPLTRERRDTHYTRAVTSNALLRLSGQCVNLQTIKHSTGQNTAYLATVYHTPLATTILPGSNRGHDGVVVRLLAYHQGEPGSVLGGVACGNRAGGWVFSGISRFPCYCIPALLHTHLASPSSALKTSYPFKCLPSLTHSRHCLFCNVAFTPAHVGSLAVKYAAKSLEVKYPGRLTGCTGVRVTASLAA